MASNKPGSPPAAPSSRPSARSSTSSTSNNTPTGYQHRPSVPSGLRQAHMPPSSPEDRHLHHVHIHGQVPEIEVDGAHPRVTEHDVEREDTEATHVQGSILEPYPSQADAKTWLLHYGQKYNVPECGDSECNHGTFSPRPRYMRGYGSLAGSVADSERSRDGYGGPNIEIEGQMDGNVYRGDFVEGHLGDAFTDGLLGQPSKKNTTHWLAKRHGVRHGRLMYLLYYLPSTNWIPQYRLSYLQGDLVAALTMASFYIPMALSYASNLGHIPPINGLYSFVFNPLLYALLGSCPQMVVGPEAAGSLLTGGVVKGAINKGHHHDHDGAKSAQIAGMVTGLAGAIILSAGICRLGFLDGVLSRPFLRGFISAIGIVILVDQLIPEMGLDTAAAHSKSASHGSSLDKILFLFRRHSETHALTCAVSFSTIAIVLLLREVKRRLQPRTPWVAYVPDRFVVVVLSAVFTRQFGWDQKGLDILGDIKSNGAPFKPEFPFASKNFHHVDDAFGTSLVIAMLGFFESSVAAKSLGTGARKKGFKENDGEEVEQEADGIKGMTVSANRELVALGVANLVGGVFMALPAFGGYGRSKVNASTGGKTPMSSVFLSLITVICVLFLLPYFYYIPKGVLSAMISVVAYSLIEEAPHDIHFFWTISGYNELILMTLIFLTTFFWNLRVGIIVGIGLSLLRLLRHSTTPRIQILGRVPGTGVHGTESVFENAESEQVEFVPHCLIVKIPEPLTFANTGSLKDRLKRLEVHGTDSAHPALPRVRRKEHNQNLIFDVHGVTSLDPAACQVLLEIVTDYVERGTRVVFCRIPSRKSEVWRLMQVSGIVDLCGGERGFFRSVDEALKATERDRTPHPEYADDEEAMVGEGTQTMDYGGSMDGYGGSGDPVAAIRERFATGREIAEQHEHDPITAR